MIQIGIYGASGYTGFELVKILIRHPEIEIRFLTSRSAAGKSLADLYPVAPALPLIAPDEASLSEVDLVFLCLPHAMAAPTAMLALQAGVRVVDLSADFRLANPREYEDWYGLPHPAPDLLSEAVYGLAEFARDQLPGSRLVANPGCYPTSILLALRPILASGLVNGTIIADSKSGVSGAGRAPKHNTHFVEVSGNFSPYKIGRSHRHLPEMEQFITAWIGPEPKIIFSPHLLPVPRGILSTVYVPLKDNADESRIRELYYLAYGDEPFIQLLPAGDLATLAHVLHTNKCALSLSMAAGTLIITSTIDNLVKGAAGQAVQNMNLMFGFDESAGLL